MQNIILLSSLIITVLSTTALPAFAHPTATKLIVVQDGGDSALPYFKELGLMAEPTAAPITAQSPNKPASMVAMLPVYSASLTPGQVSSRSIQAPYLSPIFIVGDDDLSKRWLRDRYEVLKQLGAIGLVVNVETAQGLKELQSLVPDLKLSPVAGDDIAQRLHLQHYPVLITSTQIEQ